MILQLLVVESSKLHCSMQPQKVEWLLTDVRFTWHCKTRNCGLGEVILLSFSEKVRAAVWDNSTAPWGDYISQLDQKMIRIKR